MMQLDYTFERQLELEREESLTKGENRLASLIMLLQSEGKQDEITKALTDMNVRQELYQIYHVPE